MASISFDRDPTTGKLFNYYEYLGVSPTASTSEIKSAFRKAAIDCHPDKCPGDKAAVERFHKLSKCKDVLIDEEARQRYDIALKNGSKFEQERGGFDPYEEASYSGYYNGSGPRSYYDGEPAAHRGRKSCQCENCEHQYEQPSPYTYSYFTKHGSSPQYQYEEPRTYTYIYEDPPTYTRPTKHGRSSRHQYEEPQTYERIYEEPPTHAYPTKHGRSSRHQHEQPRTYTRRYTTYDDDRMPFSDAGMGKRRDQSRDRHRRNSRHAQPYEVDDDLADRLARAELDEKGAFGYYAKQKFLAKMQDWVMGFDISDQSDLQRRIGDIAFDCDIICTHARDVETALTEARMFSKNVRSDLKSTRGYDETRELVTGFLERLESLDSILCRVGKEYHECLQDLKFAFASRSEAPEELLASLQEAEALLKAIYEPWAKTRGAADDLFRTRENKNFYPKKGIKAVDKIIEGWRQAVKLPHHF